MKKVSIILLIYNSELRPIILTLKSIILQTMNSDIEIIIADDGSERKWKSEISNYLEKYNFYNYIFAPSDKNLGTVNNILRALKFCNGEYVKLIGAGDLLFSEEALYAMHTMIEKEKFKCAFGNIQSYTIDDNKLRSRSFDAPLNKKIYLEGKKTLIKRNIVLIKDYISGASMIFEKNFLLEELRKISSIIKYAEDWIQVPIILSGESILYVPINFVLYEVGSGISTNKKTSKRLILDSKNFSKYIKQTFEDPTVEKLKKRDCLPKFLRAGVMWSANPIIRFRLTLRSFRAMKEKNVKRKDLGFLDNHIFIEEFKLSVQR